MTVHDIAISEMTITSNGSDAAINDVAVISNGRDVASNVTRLWREARGIRRGKVGLCTIGTYARRVSGVAVTSFGVWSRHGIAEEKLKNTAEAGTSHSFTFQLNLSRT
jgi:hypothetical protein